MQSVKLSLVVPIYGVEKYIYRFLESLDKNLRKGLEVILVDDGSKDNCGKIIDEYQLKNPEFVKVIHQKNGGLSVARNTGLSAASGKYIIFPDPDDYLADGYVANIFEAIEKYNFPDMVFFDYYDRVGESLKLKTVPKIKEGLVPKENFLREFAKDEKLMSTVWNKAIKKQFYKNRFFDKNVKVAEDALLLTELALELDKIVYIKKPLYYYCVREDSLTKSIDVEDAIKEFKIARFRYEKYKEILKDVSLNMPVKFAYGVLQRVYIQGGGVDTIPYEDFIKNNIKKILLSNDFSLRRKRQCLFVYFDVARRYNQWKYKK